MPKRVSKRSTGNSRKRRRTRSGCGTCAIVPKKKKSAKKKSPAEGMKLSKPMKELINKEINKDTGYQFTLVRSPVMVFREAHNPAEQRPWTLFPEFLTGFSKIFHEKNPALAQETNQTGRRLRTQNRIRGVSCVWKLKFLFPFGERPSDLGSIFPTDGNELSSFLDTLHVRVMLIHDKAALTREDQQIQWTSWTANNTVPPGHEYLFRTERDYRGIALVPPGVWWNREYENIQINRERFTVHDEVKFTIKRGIDVTGNLHPTETAHNVIYGKGDIEKNVTLRWKIKNKVFKFGNNNDLYPEGPEPFVVCLITNNRGNINTDSATEVPGYDAPLVLVSGNKAFKFENFD